jgi:hypothetical protein
MARTAPETLYRIACRVGGGFATADCPFVVLDANLGQAIAAFGQHVLADHKPGDFPMTEVPMGGFTQIIRRTPVDVAIYRRDEHREVQ